MKIIHAQLTVEGDEDAAVKQVADSCLDVFGSDYSCKVSPLSLDGKPVEGRWIVQVSLDARTPKDATE